jgi:DNA-3-methyladenine glycosylase
VNLDRSFYERDTIVVSTALLGCLLISTIGGTQKKTSGIIVETEAYLGETDPGSHAFKGKTERTTIMYGKAGTAYVYLIYGMYTLLNVVTEPVGTPGAVLIRALEPVSGIATMKERRKTDSICNLTTGPGKVTQALGITTAHNGLDMTGDLVWIEPCTTGSIHSSQRIGVHDTQPFRFFMTNPFVSKHRQFGD